MDVAFVNPRPTVKGLNDSSIFPPLGLAYMAALLEQKGWTCQILDAQALKLSAEDVLRDIDQAVKVVGIYVNSFVVDQATEVARLCRARLPKATIILGGPLATAQPEKALDNIECDGVICGEGEYAVVRIMENIRNQRYPFDEAVSGAVYRNRTTNAVIRNAIARISDLDALPFPAYHLLPALQYYKAYQRKFPGAAIMTSRGCAHECSFCSKDIFQRRVTFRSAKNVLDEIDLLVKKYGIKQLDILDDNFAFKPTRMDEILDGIIERRYGLAINPQAGMRVEILDETVLRKLKKAGFYKIPISIESADPEVLRRMHKRLDLKKAEEVITTAKKVGFLVWGFFIVGMPGETEAGYRTTVEYMKRMDFDAIGMGMAMPLPGTELYRDIENNGKFLIDMSWNAKAALFAGEPFFEMPGLKSEDVIRRYNEIYREFYTIRKRIKMISQIRSWRELRQMISAYTFLAKSWSRKGACSSR